MLREVGVGLDLKLFSKNSLADHNVPEDLLIEDLGLQRRVKEDLIGLYALTSMLFLDLG
jgi:hypothetical protein